MNQGKDDFAQDFLIEAVFAFEADGVGIMLVEEIVGVHQRVVDAEETIAVFTVPVGDVLPLLTFHLVVMLDDVARDAEGLLTVLAPVEELVFARAKDSAHCGHVHSRIDADTDKATHLLGIHSTHACSHDDVGLLVGAELTEVG